jgi:putative transposase
MNRKELEAFAKEAAKSIKNPEDLNDFSRMLKKITVEATLNTEMDEYLGYEKHAKSLVKNSDNGTTTERIS